MRALRIPVHRLRGVSPGRVMIMALGECALFGVGLSAVMVARNLSLSPPGGTYIDFDTLLLGGRLARQGELARAYAWSSLGALERAQGLGADGYSPFSYPPPFALGMSGLAALPTPAAYALFVGGGGALLAWALARLAPGRFWPLVLALSPSMFINVVAGQNGMITAGLAGAAALCTIRRRGGPAGALAGLLAAMKPHIAIALPLAFVAGRDRRALAAMAAVGATLLALSAAVLGPSIVPVFLAGVSETGAALSEGRFPLHRMTSVYAGLRGLGLPAAAAMALHLGAAAAALGIAAFLARGRGRRAGAGLALMATAFISPYFYDYDGCIVGVGLALAGPALRRSGGPRYAAVPLILFGLAGGLSAGQALFFTAKLSLGAPAMAACFACAAALLARRPAGGARQSSICMPISTARPGGRPK